MKKQFIIIFVLAICTLFGLHAYKGNDGWKDFFSIPGRCHIQFPSDPQHLQQKMGEEQDLLSYDVYVAGDSNKIVYFLLVASFPINMNEEQKHQCLEGFLSGILTNNPDNELVDAQIVHLEGKNGIDFQIKNGERHFQGRVLAHENLMYLLACECDKEYFSFEDFKKYLSSFSISSH